MTAQPGNSPPLKNASASGSPAPQPSAIARIESDDFDRNVWCVLGLPLDAANISAAAQAIETAVRDRRRLSFVTPNTNWLVRALRDDRARRQVLNADLSLADGAPLVAIARLLGAPITKRTAGSDLFETLALRPGFPGRRIRVFFFGGRAGSAEAAHARLASAASGLEAAGWFNPGFGDVASMSSEPVIAEINAAEPDFVVVALGAAKGQDWIEANQDRLTAPVIAHLGAVVDFTSGAVKRAPRWFARAGMEWAWRIFQEPALWRRYLVDALNLGKILVFRFAPQVFRARGGGGPAAAASVERRADHVMVHLSGRLAHPDLEPVREAFRQAASYGKPVVLDLASAHSADRSFLGLILMLEKNTPVGALKIAASPPNLRALFAANDMTYPRAGAVQAPGSAERGRVRRMTG